MTPSLMQSDKLRRESGPDGPANANPGLPEPLAQDKVADGTALVLEPVTCLNDWVAIFRLPRSTTLELPSGATKTATGVVVGVGPGISEGGRRTRSQLKFGDHVLFLPHTIAIPPAEIDIPFYRGRELVIVSERNVVLKLADLPVQKPAEPADHCGGLYESPPAVGDDLEMEVRK